MRKLMSSCYGSCGELFQGIVDGQELLISYHIQQKNSVVWQEHPTQDKSLAKMQAAKDLLNINPSTPLTLMSQLPIGKGCASSTADIVATLQVLAHLKGERLSARQLTALCAKIEPSDSVAFDNWTAINPLTGKVQTQFAWQPHLYVYMLEPQAIIETLTLPRMSESSGFDIKASGDLYDQLTQAIQLKDLDYLGHVTTQCALLNQTRLPKVYLAELIQFVQAEKLIGLNIAHSGTVIGLLLKPNDLERLSELEHKISRQVWANYYQTRTLHQITYQGVEVAVWN